MCAELLERVLAAHDLVLNDHILWEVERALRTKFRLPDTNVDEALSMLRGIGHVVEAIPLSEPVCRDPDDDAILALARTSASHLIVTGDADLLVLHPWQGIPIVRPRDFWPIDRARDG